MRIKKQTIYLIFIFILATMNVSGQNFTGDLGGLMTIKNNVRDRRIGTADITGNNFDSTGRIKRGEKKIVQITSRSKQRRSATQTAN